jgi:hypothetical protein
LQIAMDGPIAQAVAPDRLFLVDAKREKREL